MKTRGGFYQYQRDLYESVAQLNFCMYWTQTYYETKRHGARERDGTISYSVRPVRQKRHRLVGRIINTKSTIAMATYLEQAIEQSLRSRLGAGNSQMTKNGAVSVLPPAPRRRQNIPPGLKRIRLRPRSRRMMSASVRSVTQPGARGGTTAATAASRVTGLPTVPAEKLLPTSA